MQLLGGVLKGRECEPLLSPLLSADMNVYGMAVVQQLSWTMRRPGERKPSLAE